MPKIHFFTQQDNTPPDADADPAPPPKKKVYHLTNWPQYNNALIQRGAITLWLDEQTLAEWYYNGPQLPGGSYRYSDTCIRCALSIKAVLGLAFRQTQGLIKSLLEVMKLDLRPPSYTQLCRRQAKLTTVFEPPLSPPDGNQPGRGWCGIPTALHLVVDSTGLKVFGEGEWKVRKYGAEKRRTWRKLHLAVDQATNIIHAVELTTNAMSDADMIKPLLAAIEQPITKLGGDGAYDQVKVYDILIEKQIHPLIPPRVNAVRWTDETGNDLVHPRNESLSQIDAVGLAHWKQQSGYHRRSLAETAMFRWKTTFGDRLSARLLSHQQTETRIKANCLNRFAQLGMPKTVNRNST